MISAINKQAHAPDHPSCVIKYSRQKQTIHQAKIIFYTRDTSLLNVCGFHTNSHDLPNNLPNSSMKIKIPTFHALKQVKCRDGKYTNEVQAELKDK